VTQAHPGFAPLDGARTELEAIVKSGAASRGILDGEVYLDGAFTQERLRRSLNNPVLHVASHFKFNPNEADSFLLLGDGIHLTLKEVRESAFDFQDVDLLTLSACETAVGGAGQGREVEGLAVTAQRKGAKGVLATLWPVADASTAALMQRVYALRESNRLTKAEALRQAQIELLEGKVKVDNAPRPIDRQMRAPPTGRWGQTIPSLPCTWRDAQRPYAHPYYWAPFILMGNRL
jgi:CHAT domain-containing protein